MFWALLLLIFLVVYFTTRAIIKISLKKILSKIVLYIILKRAITIVPPDLRRCKNAQWTVRQKAFISEEK